ncbi:MAG: hypothetical protein DRN88_02865 [Candidatus Hydrothermarchaeota archaeon]|nr:MAG: hypothetical protein DRN88_02865 [Candidatus Hydrothermarchaeota archaeon]
MSEIESLIINLPERNSVILLELDYLILKQGFEKIFKFIQRIREVLYVLNKGILIFTISPDFLKNEYIKLIKMECEDIRPKRRRIPYEMYEVLRYVYKLNRVGEKPSIKELISELKIARNTCKKRIKYLENRGLIKTIKAGRTKILEITEKGKEFFY